MKAGELTLTELGRMLMPGNPKDHDIGGIDASVSEFGFIDRIIVNEVTGHILGGNGRVEELMGKRARGEAIPVGIERRGSEWLAPVDFVAIPVEKEMRLVIALNRWEESGGWKDKELADALVQIASEGGPEALLPIGFDGDELDELLARMGMSRGGGEDEGGVEGEDDILGDGGDDLTDALVREWGVRHGQIWEIANREKDVRGYLAVGDSREGKWKERMLELGGFASVDICITDPPYNVGKEGFTEKTDENMSKDEYIAWSREWLRWCPERLVLTSGVKRMGWWGEIVGKDPQWTVAWVKMNGQGRTGLGGVNKWDPILVWNVETDEQVDVIQMANDYREGIAESSIHPTAKPVELFRVMVRRWGSGTEGVVYEPFAGTGTALVACLSIGVCCVAIEIEPKYVAYSLERLKRLLDAGRQGRAGEENYEWQIRLVVDETGNGVEKKEDIEEKRTRILKELGY